MSAVSKLLSAALVGRNSDAAWSRPDKAAFMKGFEALNRIPVFCGWPSMPRRPSGRKDRLPAVGADLRDRFAPKWSTHQILRRRRSLRHLQYDGADCECAGAAAIGAVFFAIESNQSSRLALLAALALFVLSIIACAAFLTWMLRVTR
jgi:hypothetical protein